METIEAKVQRQLKLEEDMSGLGIARFREQVSRTRELNEEASSKTGSRLLQQALMSTHEVVKTFLATAKGGKAGRKHVALKFLLDIEPEVIAFIVAKRVLDSISLRWNLTTAAKAIGQVLEEELWFREFAEQKPGLWNTVSKQMKDMHVQAGVRQSRIKQVARKYEVEHTHWTSVERLLVGTKCLDMFIEATGWIEKVRIKEGKTKTPTYIKATDALMEFINSENSRCEILTPVFLPMIVPPRDWTTPTNGGYYSRALSRAPMIKTMNRAFMEELRNHEMPQVYDAINALQRTAWQVNDGILDVIKDLFAVQSQLGKLPSVKAEEIPAFPKDEANKEAIQRWRKAAAVMHEGNTKRRSKRVACAKAIWVAEKLVEEEEFYFPYYADFRGRVYARPLFLTPQGADYSKALLRFAIGIELGETGACWLAIHGANTWGTDKVSLQARIDWVQDNEDKILEAAANPLDFHWWGEADKPFQFLAFCQEWAGFKEQGASFQSKLPVALDGSCNGLQNFSMALRDSVGGRAVNLIPSDTPNDIYQSVADLVTAKLCLLTSTDDTVQRELAQQWIASGLVTRKLTKQPVMTLPYGAKQYGMRGGVAEFLLDAQENGKVLPFGEDGIFPASTFICGLIWTSIGEVVIAARQAMDFLQGVATVASMEGLPIHWTTPVGFPVLQEYRELITKRVKTQVGGETIQLILAEDGEKLDRRKQSAGISPNFVHSLDSSHMMATVNLSVDNGMCDFAMVHDSFGTHAANTEALSVCLRHAFVNQYRGNVLTEFHAHVATQLSPEIAAQLPPVPEMGDLDIEQVLLSDFFFA